MAAPKKRTGLGRGIGALIPTSEDSARPVDVFFAAGGSQSEAEGVATVATAVEGLSAVPGAQLLELSVGDIAPNPMQPRTDFREAEFQELVTSVREFGVLQPIVVRPRFAKAPGEQAYELVMGERRLRASKAAGLERIPAVVKNTADDDMLRDALLENLHRANLNPMEEASAYQQLLADFGITQEALADRIGRSRPQITNTLRLLQLPESVQQKVASGVLSAGHARAVLAAGEAGAMVRLANKIVNEGLSVRAAETAAGIGSGATKQRVKPRAGSRQGALNEVAERMGDRLNTRVRITLGSGKGQISIDFATVADLNRILEELGEPSFRA